MRLTLRDYIDNPDLLDQISMSELQAWASEVPYAGLIHRLMLLKAERTTSDTIDIRGTLLNAVITSSDPAHIIATDQRYIARDEDESSDTYVNEGIIAEEELPIITDVVSLEVDSQAAIDLPDDTPSSSAILLGAAAASTLGDMDNDTSDKVGPVEGKVNQALQTTTDSAENIDGNNQLETIQSVDNQNANHGMTQVLVDDESEEEDDDNVSSFSEWLQTLKQIETEEETDITLRLKEDVASEALAQLLSEQGYITKAVHMYEQLILKYPEKSSFFAAQIEKIKAS